MKSEFTANNPFGNDRYGYLWEMLAKHKPLKHLDYGAYNGRIINQMVKDGLTKEAIGVDANKDIVDESNPKLDKFVSLKYINPKPVVVLPFADNTFDSVSLLDVLEHVFDQRTLIDELIRVLKPKGVLIITVPQHHIFSFLDIANVKFRFPRLHKFLHNIMGKEALYYERFVECRNGLFGDIELEKMWHQHFTPQDLIDLVEEGGCECDNFDGAGLFDRFLIPMFYLFGNHDISGTTSILQKIRQWDLRRFNRAHLFTTFVKK